MGNPLLVASMMVVQTDWLLQEGKQNNITAKCLPKEKKKITIFLNKLDVDPRLDDDVSPDIVLKIDGSMMQTCRNMNVHVVNTDIC